MESIVLVTSDHFSVTVPVEIKRVSGLIAEIENDSPIPLPDLSKPVLDLMLQYQEHHCYICPPPIHKPLSSARIEDAVFDPWDAEFINSIEEPMLIDLVMGCNYIDMYGLFDLCCAKIATNFKGKTVEELKLKYNIKEDLTPEMEEKILRENPWITSDSPNS